MKKSWWHKVGFLLIGSLFIFLIWLTLQQPSHNRDWEIGQEKLPYITIDYQSGAVKIDNFRDFIWRKDQEPIIKYKNIQFNIKDIETVDVVISHFEKFEGMAHIFLSFGLRDGRHIAVSLETRREKNEEFSPWLGLLRQFEIIYVMASENDIIGLRTDVREGERVYLYPTIATPDKAQELFLVLAEEINEVYRRPKIYNTLTHNCTNEITRRVEEISSLDFPLTWKTLFPGYFDEVLYEMKIIPHNKPFEEVKREYFVDNNKVNYLSPDYSKQLRAGWRTEEF